jgi:lactate dehydrogenase-like 2-hydroxyacid dehydrogenase
VECICKSPVLILSGKRIDTIAKALGMTVIISERKGASSTATRPDRTEFYEMLEKSDVVVLCCPLDGSTRGMIGLAELKHMHKDTILVNVSRGGTVDEAALAMALKEHWIGAAATDVFAAGE